MAWAVGQQAVYEGTGPTGTMTMSFSIVGKEGDDWWYEMKTVASGQTTIMKMLMPAPTMGGSPKRIIMQSAMGVFEIPASSMQAGQQAQAQITSDAQVNGGIVGRETKTVKGGTFANAVHSRYTAQTATTDGYFHSSVPVTGMVSTATTITGQGTISMEMVSFKTSGAVSEITGTPQQMPTFPGLPPGTTIPGR